MSSKAGTTATQEDLIDVDQLLSAYHELKPDPENPAHAVVFGTSGHRGSSLNSTFNDDHIAATTQAIVEYRASQNLTGPLLMGMDTHALSAPAQQTALEVLAGNNVTVWLDSREGYTPTPAVSLAILDLNRQGIPGGVDGIVITPSHNPPGDGGFKYNPAHGGPADSDATNWIAARANELLKNQLDGVERLSAEAARNAPTTGSFDFLDNYVSSLPSVIDIEAIATSGLRIGADPMGGASVAYWAEIASRYQLPIEVLNDRVDPRWSFMSLDWDGKIRMDPSSPSAMATLIAQMQDGELDLATGNDADADRHGIVTADAGLMNPNHYLAVAIDFLYSHRPSWGADTGVGKTLVSSSMIDRVVARLGRTLLEVPVGFKWFVPGLLEGSIGFGGEESAGASLLRKDGTVWSTDKDGIVLALLASEITAVTGKTPSQLYQELSNEFGDPAYARVDAPANAAQKAALSKLSESDVTATELAGEEITAKLTAAPGNGAPLGGLKVTTENAWFAARPSGTEDVYKIYAESFKGAEHLSQVQAEAKALVDSIINT